MKFPAGVHTHGFINEALVCVETCNLQQHGAPVRLTCPDILLSPGLQESNTHTAIDQPVISSLKHEESIRVISGVLWCHVRSHRVYLKKHVPPSHIGFLPPVCQPVLHCRDLPVCWEMLFISISVS